jgi:hypothetical protein
MGFERSNLDPRDVADSIFVKVNEAWWAILSMDVAGAP